MNDLAVKAQPGDDRESDGACDGTVGWSIHKPRSWYILDFSHERWPSNFISGVLFEKDQ